MNSIPVLTSFETPNKTIADTEKAYNQSSSKSDITKNSTNPLKKDFKKQLEDCESLVTEKQPLLQAIVDFGEGCTEKSDNSMCNDSGATNNIAGIVGTLEGFELLGYQADNNISDLPEELLSIFDDAIMRMNELPPESKAELESFFKGMLNDSEQGKGLSEQFAWMRLNKTLDASSSMTQQEVLQKVGEYLCSFESTNKNTADNTLSNDLIEAQKADSLLLGDKSEPGKAGINIKPEGAGIDAKSENTAFNAKPERAGINAKSVETAFNARPEEADISVKQKEPAVNLKTEKADINAEPENTTLAASGTDTKVTQNIGQTKNTQSDTVLAKENVLSIVEKVSIKSAEGKQDFDIQLKPEYLGKLSIKLSMENGSIKIMIKAQDASVKGLVSDQLSALQDIFRVKGIPVNNIDVLCENNAFSQQEKQMSEQNSGSGREGETSKWRKMRIADTANVSVMYDTLLNSPDIYSDTSSVMFLA